MHTDEYNAVIAESKRTGRPIINHNLDPDFILAKNQFLSAGRKLALIRKCPIVSIKRLDGYECSVIEPYFVSTLEQTIHQPLPPLLTLGEIKAEKSASIELSTKSEVLPEVTKDENEPLQPSPVLPDQASVDSVPYILLGASRKGAQSQAGEIVLQGERPPVVKGEEGNVGMLAYLLDNAPSEQSVTHGVITQRIRAGVRAFIEYVNADHTGDIELPGDISDYLKLQRLITKWDYAQTVTEKVGIERNIKDLLATELGGSPLLTGLMETELGVQELADYLFGRIEEIQRIGGEQKATLENVRAGRLGRRKIEIIEPGKDIVNTERELATMETEPVDTETRLGLQLDHALEQLLAAKLAHISKRDENALAFLIQSIDDIEISVEMLDRALKACDQTDSFVRQALLKVIQMKLHSNKSSTSGRGLHSGNARLGLNS